MSRTTTDMQLVATEKLVPYVNNARTHSAEQIMKLRSSLREFGFINPIIIDKDYNIIAGHGRLMAAKDEGIREVPCVFVDYLTEAQKKAYILADNRMALDAGWDKELLKVEIEALQAEDFDLGLTGFDEKELASFFDADNDVHEDDFDVDAELEKPPVTKTGDVWLLGRHRLVCGDSTKEKTYTTLMKGEQANLVVTDPPYNMHYVGAGRERRDPILNDKMPDDAFAAFLAAAYAAAADALIDGGALYAFYKELGTGVFVTALAPACLTFRQELVWVKNQPVLGGAKYQNMYEPLVFATKGDSCAVWNGGRKERSALDQIDLMNEEELRAALKALLNQEPTDVLREPKPQRSDLHPTMKPIRLLARLIRNSTNEGDIVLDIFGGSGSTLMACEQMGRRCRMVELDPAFCDVIVRRWEAFTGRKAVRHEA